MIDEVYTPSVDMFVAVRSPDYEIAVEPIRDRGRHMLHIHCGVSRWSPSVFRAMQRDIALLQSNLERDLYALHREGDKKHLSFMRAGGFVDATEDWENINGEPRRLYVRPYKKEAPL